MRTLKQAVCLATLVAKVASKIVRIKKRETNARVFYQKYDGLFR